MCIREYYTRTICNTTEKEKYYPLLARKATLGSAHWCLVH